MEFAVLGPKGTFSDSACNEYFNKEKIDRDITKINFYNSIPLVFKAVYENCEYGVIPIENCLDGYVQKTRDGNR